MRQRNEKKIIFLTWRLGHAFATLLRTSIRHRKAGAAVHSHQ
jgi:hypothetical protein